MEIKRRIKGKTSNYPIHPKDEADIQKLSYVYWKQAEVGDWALTDDGFVSECFGRASYTDKAGHVKTFIKLTCGVGWDTGFSKINFLINQQYGVYSKTNPKRTWDEEESGKTRSKNTVNAYSAAIWLTITLLDKSIDLTKRLQQLQLGDFLNKK